MKKFLVFAFACLLCTSCTTKIQSDRGFLSDETETFAYKIGAYNITTAPPKNELYRRERLIDKNYARGHQNVALTGEPMVRVRSYNKQVFRTNSVRPIKDFTFIGGATHIPVFTNERYDIIGSIEFEGRTYDLMKVSPVDLLLIKRNGRLLGKVARLENGKAHMISYDFYARPSDVRIVYSGKENESISPYSTNFEVRYDGLKNNHFYITYLDYMPQTGKRSGYFETFSFPRGTANISIRGMSIRVLGAHADKIDYIVLNEPPY